MAPYETALFTSVPPQIVAVSTSKICVHFCVCFLVRVCATVENWVKGAIATDVKTDAYNP